MTILVDPTGRELLKFIKHDCQVGRAKGITSMDGKIYVCDAYTMMHGDMMYAIGQTDYKHPFEVWWIRGRMVGTDAHVDFLNSHPRCFDGLTISLN